MTTRDQKINKNSVEKKNNGKLKRSDYLRIKLLFAKWRNWLFYLTVGYFVIFLTWRGIKGKLIELLGPADSSIKNEDWKLWFWRFPILISLTILRGLVFCADGIVSSWLKSPFGQISYSINKSAIESWKSDEIVTILTEINEHFKETFKKFGVFTISKDIWSIFIGLIDNVKKDKTGKEEKENSGFFVTAFLRELLVAKNSVYFDNFLSLSLLIPIILAIWRMRTAEKIIKNLEPEDD